MVKDQSRMPHVCGDEPDFFAKSLNVYTVCPTYVGMNRSSRSTGLTFLSMPHVCGDEPRVQNYRRYRYSYAPRMWG